MSRHWNLRTVAPLCAALLASCSPGVNSPPPSPEGVPDAQARIELRRFVEAQQLTQGPLDVIPSEHDWSFIGLDQNRRASEETSGSANWPATTLTYRTYVPGMRTCFAVGAYKVTVSERNDCPGDWLAFRADGRSSGTSTFRLNWHHAPQEVASRSLETRQFPDSLRLLAHADALLGERLYVNNGSAVESYRADGSLAWRQEGLGIGEVIDVTDLDGDGQNEVIFSPGSRWNTLNPGGAGPGELIVLAAQTGEVLWRHAFEGIEFGLNRRRVSIVPNADGPGKSLYAVMTYSQHLWRFDFAAGVRFGHLKWKSAPMIYDSPDKAPLIVDLDGDGISEAVVDTYATLYVFRLSDGGRISRTPYAANRYSFGGFLTAADLDGDGRPEVVGVSNSPYMKDAFAARYENGAFRVLWRREWEEGLTATTVELRELKGLVRPDGASRPVLMWSYTELDLASPRHLLELTDALTGEVVAKREDAELLDLLRAPDGAYRVVTASKGRVLTLTRLTANGFGDGSVIPARRWVGVTRAGVSPFIMNSGQAANAAVVVDLDNRTAVLELLPNSQLATRPLVGGESLSGPLLQFEGVSTTVATGAGGELARLDTPARVPTVWAKFTPRVFGTPLIADLDHDGRRELVIPFQSGTGLARSDQNMRLSISPLIVQSPEQQRESFHVPLIVRSPGTAGASDRIVVGYTLSESLALTALNASGLTLWRWTPPRTNWERSLVIGLNLLGDQTLFFNDSRITAAINPVTGTVRWTSPVLGECQRQIATVDWNGDGIADVALQAGAMVHVVDGATGGLLQSDYATASYGGYVVATNNLGTPALGVFGAGGLAVVDARSGMLMDEQLDDRKVESLPPVVGRGAGKGGEWMFQISGSGVLRRMAADGTDRSQVDLNVPVLSMTGAYIDRDDSVDLLVSTYRGEVIAICGDTLRELWRVQLSGAAGPAVATDLNGDGRGEIVVVTSDGVVRVLAHSEAPGT